MSILATARLNYAWAECMRTVRVNPLGAGVRGCGGAPCLGRECLRDFDVPSTLRPSQLPLTLHAWLRASIEIEFTALDGPKRLDKRKRLRSHLFRCPFTTFHFILRTNYPKPRAQMHLHTYYSRTTFKTEKMYFFLKKPTESLNLQLKDKLMFWNHSISFLNFLIVLHISKIYL